MRGSSFTIRTNFGLEKMPLPLLCIVGGINGRPVFLQPLDQAFAASRARPVHQDATAFVRRCQKSEVRNQKLSFILKWYSCPVRILLLVALDDLDL